MKIEKHCDGNVIIVEDFLSQEEITQLDSFMRNFDYNNLQEHEFKYWGKRLINDYQMKLNPGYENVMDGVLPTLNSIIQRRSDWGAIASAAYFHVQQNYNWIRKDTLNL